MNQICKSIIFKIKNTSEKLCRIIKSIYNALFIDYINYSALYYVYFCLFYLEQLEYREKDLDLDRDDLEREREYLDLVDVVYERD